MSLLIYFIVLFFIGLYLFLSLVLCLTLNSSNSALTILSKYVYLSLYSIRIASLQGNHGYFSYIVVNNKNKNKIRQGWKILQLSFTLLCTIICLIILLTLHNNMRIAKNNLAFPLLKDMFTLLESSKCEVLLVLDLKDAFHSLRLTESSKKYCGILPYFSSASYLYQRMPMGLNISPMVWQSYINAILSCLSSRKYCEAIMDDLLLFTPNKQMHFEKLIDLLRALCKNGLKISPKKCQLFKTELQYMGNTIFIKEKRVCVKPLQSRLEAIQKLKPPTNQKGC